MDQKKTLWIIAAVGAFLLVVIGTAGFMYGEGKNQATYANAQVNAPAENYSGWTNQQVPGTTPPVYAETNTSGMLVFSDNTTVYDLSQSDSTGTTTIDLNALKQELALDSYAKENQTPVTAPAAPQQQNINITVNVPENATTKIEETTTPVKPAANDYYVAAPAKTTKPAKAASTTAKTTATVTKATKTSTGSTTVTSSKPVTQFWVQVAAYSNKKGAEAARTVLDENKIPADVFTYEDNKSRLFYRVRVGPYTTKSEAEYWRTKIVKINEFSKAESYITSTTN